jgi:hypothetical protein
MALWPSKKEEKPEDVPKIQIPHELQTPLGAAHASPRPVAKPLIGGGPVPAAPVLGAPVPGSPVPAVPGMHREAPRTPEGLEALAGSLGHVGRLLEATKQQVADYLLYREAHAAAPAPQVEGVQEVLEKLDILAERLEHIERLAETASGGEGGPAAPAGAPGASEEAIKGLVQPLQKKIDALEHGLRAIGQHISKPGAEAAIAPMMTHLGQISAGINAHHEAVLGSFGQLQGAFGQIHATIAQLQQRMDGGMQHLNGGMQHISQLLQPPEPEPEPEPEPAPEPEPEPEVRQATATEWERAILGDTLAGDPSLAEHRGQLLDGVLAAEKTAMSLTGELLIFRSAPAERMAQLLKDIGEAYYRWQPKADASHNPFETALAAWLQSACDEAGIGNRIELVHPGERFDAARHTAAERGVEITQVLGWVVVRDNGRVYTKAMVAVR